MALRPLLVLPVLAALTAPLLGADEKAKKAFYDPVVQKIEGWTVHVDPKLLQGEHAEQGAAALSDYVWDAETIARENGWALLTAWIPSRRTVLVRAGWPTPSGSPLP